jgi:hypothetical protein
MFLWWINCKRAYQTCQEAGVIFKIQSSAGSSVGPLSQPHSISDVPPSRHQTR